MRTDARSDRSATCSGGDRTGRRPRGRARPARRRSKSPVRNESSTSRSRRSAISGTSSWLDLGEDARHLRRLHLRLEVVEQDVVRLVLRRRSTRRSDGAARRCARAAAGRARSSTSPSPRARPGADSAAARAISAAQLRPAPAPPSCSRARATRIERAVPGVGIERVARLELVEQPADLGIDERLVREPLQERDVLRRDAGRRPAASSSAGPRRAGTPSASSDWWSPRGGTSAARGRQPSTGA